MFGSAVQWLFSVPRTLLGSCEMSGINCKINRAVSLEYLNVTGFAIIRCTIGLKTRVTIYPIRNKTKINRDSFAHPGIFPRLASATCICLAFDWSSGLPVSFVIGQTDFFSFGFQLSDEDCSYK